jgi:hypothetical protein
MLLSMWYFWWKYYVLDMNTVYCFFLWVLFFETSTFSKFYTILSEYPLLSLTSTLFYPSTHSFLWVLHYFIRVPTPFSEFYTILSEYPLLSLSSLFSPTYLLSMSSPFSPLPTSTSSSLSPSPHYVLFLRVPASLRFLSFQRTFSLH